MLYMLVGILVTLVLIFIIALVSVHRRTRSFLFFMKGAFVRHRDVGAPAPCSRFVGQEISHYILHNNNSSLKILEIGAGTGALTQEIYKKLRPADQLDIVEIVPEYCKILNKKFGHEKNISIQCKSILDWKPQYQYDVIICSLPFNLFDVDFVTQLLEHFKKLIKPGGMFSYIELMWLTDLKYRFVSQAKREELGKTIAKMSAFRKQFAIKTIPVYLNVTPVYVYHLKIN